MFFCIQKQCVHRCVNVIVSATNSVHCNFDDVDICGYKDLSDSGINWAQFHNPCESISYLVRDCWSRSTLCPKNMTTFSTITLTITIIFGIVSGKSMCHQKMVSFPTSPIFCNYLTLGNHRTQKMTNFAVSNILFCE